MKQSGEYKIKASRQTVWEGLNDPATLAECLIGCQRMERIADNKFATTIQAKVGPVSAKFEGEIQLEDIVPGKSYTLVGNVKGGAAGFGKGKAAVQLADDGDMTILTYQVDATIGGKLAQIGSRLVDVAARKMADSFFLKFGKTVGGVEVEDQPESNSRFIWVVGLGLLALGMVYWGLS